MARKPKNETGLRLRGGVWHMYVRIDGKLHEKSSRTDNKTEARLRRQEWVTELRKGNVTASGRPTTFDTFVQRYSDEIGCRQKAWSSKKYMLKLLVERLGHRRVRSLRASDLDELRHWLTTTPYRRKGKDKKTGRPTKGKPQPRSKATVNRYTALFQALITTAEKWGLIRPEHAIAIHRVKLVKEENERIRRLTDEEAITLLESCDSRLYPIVSLALFTGMRKSEILGLRWRDIDYETGFIRLASTKAGRARNVPMSSRVKELLRTLPRNIKHDYIFGGRHNKGARTDIKNAFPQAVEKAGLVDLRFHDLRHTFASNCAMAGATEHELMSLLGHTSTRMVRRYTHITETHLADRVESVVRKLAKSWQEGKKKSRPCGRESL